MLMNRFSRALLGAALLGLWQPLVHLRGEEMVPARGGEIAVQGLAATRGLAGEILRDRELEEVLKRAKALLQTGLTAGSGYGEVWIRDLNTFLELALQVNDAGPLREALLTFFKFQGPEGDIVDGYIPEAKAGVGYKYRRSDLAPGLLAHKNTVETDQETSLVQALHTYVRVTGDRSILSERLGGLSVLDRLEWALEWLCEERFDEAHGLLWGATTVDWGDVQPEHVWGVELDESSHRAIDIYDNAMFVIALDHFIGWITDNPSRAARWIELRDGVQRGIRRHLWDGERQKFIPHLYLEGSPFPDDFDEEAIWYHGGTAVAIEAGLLSPDEIRASLEAMRNNVKKAGAASIGLTVYPPYPEGYFLNPSMAPWSYQNGGDWCWFGGRMVQQLVRHGSVAEAYAELKPMVRRVLEHEGFFEWWTRENQPRGSGQFRGSAGVLGRSIQMLQEWASGVAGTGRAVPIREVERPDTVFPNRHYVGNRAPLRPSSLVKLPIGSVRPEGWLRRMLELQADGFHGHLPEISRFLQKEGNAWLDAAGQGQHGWEEPVYWLKGFQDYAYLLDREELIREARSWIEAALNSRQTDGWFGPGEGRTGVATPLEGRDDLWPNMIMQFCLQSYHEQTGDVRVVELMTAYAGYLLAVPEERFLKGYWPRMRAGDQLHSLYWLYNRTGEPLLLELAHKVHRHAARWDQDVIDWHNVNIAQGFRQPAIYFQQSHDVAHLHASYRNWDKVRALFGQVPGGMFGSDENSRVGYTGPRQAIETCGMVEEMLSHHILLGITGDLVWADRCEDVAFNSLPASMTADLKALRYLTAPNHPQSDHVSKAPGIQNAGPMYHMDPHGHRCCQHNVGHGWPYYVQHLYYATPGDGLAAIYYAPSTVRARVGPGVEVTLRQETRYPFEEVIRLQLETPEAVAFPLHLRIPGWCEGAVIRLNGKRLGVRPRPGRYLVLDRTWRHGDRVELEFPMEVRIRTWTENQRSVSIDRGPLTYSLQIEERAERHGGTDRWPAWNLFPESPWNYGLELPRKHPGKSFRVVKQEWPEDDQPFDARRVPIRLEGRGRRVPEWTLDERGLVRELQGSPVRVTTPVEAVTLIPMGAARLRVTAFPVIGDGPGSRVWALPPRIPIRASHCYEGDSVEALIDGILPRSSGDQSVPRFTWWPRRGSEEWLEWELDEARVVSGAEVYWFDDTGAGFCRLPESWRLLYRLEDRWLEVPNPGEFGVLADGFNQARFDPVTTDALRLEVTLREGYSAGVLEWRVKP
jgi:hypothetical protein